MSTANKGISPKGVTKDMGQIRVRYGSQTYVARYRGEQATCTAGALMAAEAVARKALGDQEHAVVADDESGERFRVQVREDR